MFFIFFFRALLHSVTVGLGLLLAGCSLALSPPDRLPLLFVAAALMVQLKEKAVFFLVVLKFLFTKGGNESLGVYLVNGFMSSLHADNPAAAFSVLRIVGTFENSIFVLFLSF